MGFMNRRDEAMQSEWEENDFETSSIHTKFAAAANFPPVRGGHCSSVWPPAKPRDTLPLRRSCRSPVGHFPAVIGSAVVSPLLLDLAGSFSLIDFQDRLVQRVRKIVGAATNYCPSRERPRQILHREEQRAKAPNP